MQNYAVLGEFMGHTLSPQIHSHLFNRMNISANYSVLEVSRENINRVVDSAKTLGYAGLNVTIPYKETIIPFLDHLSPEAEQIGAVNTIHFTDGKAIGYNTDYFGFGSMLERGGIHTKGKDVTLFGAGGAAKAIIAYLLYSQVHSLTVVSPVESELSAIKLKYPEIRTVLLNEAKNLSGDIIINSTPVGMYPKINQMVTTAEIICRFKAAVDIVYNPLETQFIQTAKNGGLTTVSGLYMLIDQAIKAEEIFQNTTIDKSIGDEIFHELAQLF